jgi:hypothetical protein
MKLKKKLSQDSSVSVGTELRAGLLWYWGSIPGRDRDLSFIHNVQISSGAHLASYPPGHWGLVPRGQSDSGCEVDHVLQSSAEVKDAWIVFMAWCLIIHKDVFTGLLVSEQCASLSFCGSYFAHPCFGVCELFFLVDNVVITGTVLNNLQRIILTSRSAVSDRSFGGNG